MAWFEREFIAVPDAEKNQLVFKWPDVNIRRFSRVIVNADELALFVDAGRVVGVLEPGRHRLDADELPGLGALIDTLTGGNAYRAELYFIDTKEHPGIKFGGRLDDVQDPRSQQVVTLRVFGEYSLSVLDPMTFVTALSGTVSLADHHKVHTWCSELLLRSMKIVVTKGIVSGRWPILGLSGHMPEIDAEVMSSANRGLDGYGLRINRIGNFDINLDREDADRLKRLAKDKTYMEMAGGFQSYAAGELALGASKGLAESGGGHGSGFVGTALGLGLMAQHSPAPTPWQAAAAAKPLAATTCPDCGTDNPAEAAFCMKCAHRLA